MTEQRNDGHRAGRPDNGSSQAAATCRAIPQHPDESTASAKREDTSPLQHLLSSMGTLPRIVSEHSGGTSDLMTLLERLHEQVDQTWALLSDSRPRSPDETAAESVCPPIPDRCTVGELGHWLSNLARPRLAPFGHSTSCCVDQRLDSLPAPSWLIRLVSALPQRMCRHSAGQVSLDVHCSLEHQQLIVEMVCSDQCTLTSMLGPADMSDSEHACVVSESEPGCEHQAALLPIWRCLAHLADCCVMLDGIDEPHLRSRARLIIAAPITQTEHATGAGRIPMAG